MADTLISFTTAKLAQELGFTISGGRDLSPEEALWILKNLNKEGYYPNLDLLELTQTALQKWLREEKSIHVEITCSELGWSYTLQTINGKHLFGMRGYPYQDHEFSTYEEALEKGMYMILKKHSDDKKRRNPLNKKL